MPQRLKEAGYSYDDGGEKSAAELLSEVKNNAPIKNTTPDDDRTSGEKIVDVLEGGKTTKSDGTNLSDSSGDGIPDSYVSDASREGNLKQDGIRRYFQKDKNVVDLELAAHDFKKNIKSGKYMDDIKSSMSNLFSGANTTTDTNFPTKYKKGKEYYNDGGQITPVKGIGKWGGKDVPGMFKGRDK